MMITDTKFAGSLEIKDATELDLWLEQGEDGEGKRQRQRRLPSPSDVELLRLGECEKLEKLPQSLHTLASLKTLHIHKCQSLVSLPNTGKLPPALEMLQIYDCKALSCVFPGGDQTERHGMPPSSCCLKALEVRWCPSLTCVSSSGPLPPSLEGLHIDDCQRLEWVAEGGMAPHSSLRSITIQRCPELKSLPDGLLTLSFLRKLYLKDCHNLESLSQGGSPPTTSLETLEILGCEKLEGLPIHHLTSSLQSLRIASSPGIIISSPSLFTSLKSLDLDDISIYRNVNNNLLGFHGLPSLTELIIRGPCEDLMSLLSDEYNTVAFVLPTSLLRLQIWNFPNLEKLSSKPFHNLISLQFLTIRDCPKLTSIPHQLLPPSLLHLEFINCPLLKPQLAKGKGQLWPNIQYIPRVEMDYRSVFVQEDEEHLMMHVSIR